MRLFEFFKKQRKQKARTEQLPEEEETEQGKLGDMEEEIKELCPQQDENAKSPEEKKRNIDLLRGKIIKGMIQTSNTNTYDLVRSGYYGIVINLNSMCVFETICEGMDACGHSWERCEEIKLSEFKSEEYWYMQTEEDWKELLNEDFRAAKEKVEADKRKEEEMARQRLKLRFAVVIPDAFYRQVPRMNIKELRITLTQRYGSSRCELSKKDDGYRVSSGRYYRKLSSAEAVWIEKRVQNYIRNPNSSTQQSLAGGDRLQAEICYTDGTKRGLCNGEPLKKCWDLKSDLDKLAEYGSFSETEARPLGRYPTLKADPVSETNGKSEFLADKKKKERVPEKKTYRPSPQLSKISTLVQETQNPLYEKIQLADGDMAASFAIRIRGYDTSELGASLIIYKGTQKVSYILTCAKYKEKLAVKCVHYIRKTYQLAVGLIPVCDDYWEAMAPNSESELFCCEFTIDKCKVELSLDLEFGAITTCRGEAKDIDFLDEFVARMLLGIMEDNSDDE